MDDMEKVIVSKPGVYAMEIAHDNWCNFLNGGGKCNCNPDVEIKKAKHWLREREDVR